MRQRFQLNLNTSNEIDEELSLHLHRFSQGHARSEELKRIVFVGYQMLYQGKSRDEALLDALDPAIKSALVGALSLSSEADESRTQAPKRSDSFEPRPKVSEYSESSKKAPPSGPDESTYQARKEIPSGNDDIFGANEGISNHDDLFGINEHINEQEDDDDDIFDPISIL